MARKTGPLYWPIDLYGDDSWSLSVTFTDGADPLDVTDRAYAAHVRPAPESVDVLVAMTVDLAGAATGVIAVALPAGATVGLSGWWELKESIPNSTHRVTLLAGPVSWSWETQR